MRVTCGLLLPISRGCDQLGLKSIAFPPISTGIYGFPKQRAAEIAVTETRGYNGEIERVVFACFDAETADIYRGLLKSLVKTGVRYIPSVFRYLRQK